MTRSIFGHLLAVCGFVAVTSINTYAADDINHWYGSIGIGRAELSPAEDAPWNFYDKTKTGYKGFGGYQFNKNFAFEGGYVNFGNHKGSIPDENGFTNPSPDSWKFSAYTAAAVGTLPLGNDLSALGKVGVAFGKMGEYDSDGTTAVKRKPTLLLGVGVRYDILKNVFMQAEYEYFGKVGAAPGPQSPGQWKPSLLSASIGLSF